MRPTWAEINLDAVRRNYDTIREIIGDDTSVMAIVKADAYGHGVVEVSRTLSDSGVAMFGVATVEEAVELREAGIKEPVVLLGGIQDDEIEYVLEHGFVPCVYNTSTVAAMQKAASKKGVLFPCHLKFDTGMSRLGFQKQEVPDLIDMLTECSNLKIDGLFTHFSSADESDRSYTDYQTDQFHDVVRMFKQSGYDPKYLHMANSAALQKYPETISNLVRPGIMLYGACSYNDVKLHPVMCVKSRVIQIKELPSGTSVSYGRSYRTERRTKIAIVPIGYADGYLRSLSNTAMVSVKGNNVPVIGKVCMDFTMLDITDLNDVEIGEEVVLFGNKDISIEDVARWGNTIPYEIMTIVGKRVRKVFY